MTLASCALDPVRAVRTCQLIHPSILPVPKAAGTGCRAVARSGAEVRVNGAHGLLMSSDGAVIRQAMRRGSFDSVRELTAAIRRFIDGWNERCQPFTWTKAADEILAKVIRKEIFVNTTPTPLEESRTKFSGVTDTMRPQSALRPEFTARVALTRSNHGGSEQSTVVGADRQVHAGRALKAVGPALAPVAQSRTQVAQALRRVQVWSERDDYMF
jgi:hypothetical protein